MDPVFLLGAARTDFKRNLRKEGKGLRDLIVEAGSGAIRDAGIEPGEIQAGIVGNFAGGLFTRQLHLGSLLMEIDPRLLGLPTLHVEAACASGSVAVLTGAEKIQGGLAEAVLVVGAEQQKTMSPSDGSDVLAAAGDYAAEKPGYGDFMFPKLFGAIAEAYRKKHGLTDRDLALVAVKNYSHARRNPLAQMRDRTLSLDDALAETADNPKVAPPLKITDCSQITDGAAALVLGSERLARKLAGGPGKRPLVRLAGSGWTTDRLALDRKEVPFFPIARRAVEKALAMAGVGPRDIHGVEIHDCFSISEIVGYEILGLAEPGAGARLLASGATAHPAVRAGFANGPLPFSIPVNPGGGLMGDGHPVGATGVRQVHDAFRQLTASAGPTQIDGATCYLTFNMGGSFTTNVAMIWTRE